MKPTRPERYLTRAILAFVRDEGPTPERFVDRYGPSCFHVLRKSGVIVEEGGRLRLNRQHLSPDGTRFIWGIQRIHLDEDRVDIVRWGPGGPPVNDGPP